MSCRFDAITRSTTCLPCCEISARACSVSERRWRQTNPISRHSSRNRRVAESSQPSGSSPAGFRSRAEMLGLRKSTRAFREGRPFRLVRAEGRVSRGHCRLRSKQSPRAEPRCFSRTRSPTVSPSPVSSSERRDESRVGPSSPKVLATLLFPPPPSRSRGRGNRSARRSSPRLQCPSSEHPSAGRRSRQCVTDEGFHHPRLASLYDALDADLERHADDFATGRGSRTRCSIREIVT